MIDYIGAMYVQNDTLKFIHHSEGRTVMGDSIPEYQYFLKDHLGNTRITFTSKTEFLEYTATFEDQDDQSDLFDNYDSLTIITGNLYNHTPDGSKVVRLSGSDNEIVGPGLSLVVYPGDVVDMEVYAKHYAPDNENSNAVNLLGAAFQSAFANTLQGGLEHLFNNANASDNLFGMGSLFGPGDDDWNTGAPKAFMTFILLDKNLQVKDYGFKQISTASLEDGSNVPHEKLERSYTVPTEGILFVYLSNENDKIVDVFFDDFKVKVTQSPVIQETSYFPFGMVQSTSYQRAFTMKNSFLFNGMEHDESTGWDDFGARMYMADIGRWGVIDPLAEEMRRWSPYNFAFNNPLRFTDPDGMSPDDAVGSNNDDGFSGLRAQWRSQWGKADTGGEFVEAFRNGGGDKDKKKKTEENGNDNNNPTEYLLNEFEHLLFDDQNGEISEFAAGVAKCLSALARYDAFVQWIKEDKPHFINPATNLPRKNLVPDTYDLGQHIASGTKKIRGKLNTQGVVAEFYYTEKNGHLVNGTRLYNNLNTYGMGPNGPAIALTGDKSEIAYIFFSSNEARNTFLNNYYYARKAAHLEHFRSRGK